MNSKLFRRIGILAMTAVMAFSMAAGASAAEEADAIIDTARKTSLTLFKYDMTSAEDDGAWSTETYVSTGIRDETVNTVLSPYAVQGVEFSYVRLADVSIFKENIGADHTIMPTYGFREDVNTGSTATVDFLSALGLSTDDAFVTKHDSAQNRIWYFKSDTLVDALSSALQDNATNTKAALEAYMAENGGTAMPETDETGKAQVQDMPQGLYLVVETRVPEFVVDTTEPFLVSLPSTTVDGTAWNYDVTVYPKNATGSPDLEKTVREAKADTGKHDGRTEDIHDGYAHTATGSGGDVMEYQILSTLPAITSPATALSQYTYVDKLSKGIKYNGANGENDVKIEFFTEPECENRVTSWTAADGTFTAEYTDYDPVSGSSMTIRMTEAGLDEINSSTAVYDPETSLFRGYSGLTMRITYACTVNSDASAVCGDSGNPNEVTLTWSRTNTDYHDTLRDCCHVYTYAMDLTKEFSDGAGSFDRVEFLVHNTTDGYFVRGELNEAEGIWYVTGHTDKEAEATRFRPMSGEANHGKVVLKGLEDDTYVITETATDAGYKLLKESITVEILSASGSERCPVCEAALLTASARVNGRDAAMTGNSGSVHAAVPLTVTNTRGFDLPQTGGSHSGIPYIAGSAALLAGLSMVLLILRKKKHG